LGVPKGAEDSIRQRGSMNEEMKLRLGGNRVVRGKGVPSAKIIGRYQVVYEGGNR